MMGLVGSLLDPSDHVTGVVCQRRRQGDRLSIWIRGDLTEDEILGVAKRVAQLLQIREKKPSGRATFEFKAHPRAPASRVQKACIDVVPGGFRAAAVDQSLDNDAILGLPDIALAK
jgi:hypothetical protein